jgi:hypothetical protein
MTRGERRGREAGRRPGLEAEMAKDWIPGDK